MPILYTPKMESGKTIRFQWPLKVYRIFNTISWPLDDNAPQWFRVVDKIYFVFAMLVFIFHNEFKVRYLRRTINDLDDFLAGVPTYLVMVEVHLRIFPMYFKREQFKKFLRFFFQHIYIDKLHNSKLYGKIQRQMFPTLVFSASYTSTVLVFLIEPLTLLFQGLRVPLYKLIPPFDFQPLPIYIPMLCIDFWIGLLIVIAIFGEANMIALLLMHLNGRYTMLKDSLFAQSQELLERPSKSKIAENFCKLIKQTLKENERLNKFAQNIQSEYSYRVFVIFAFTAITLCALGFKVYTSPYNSFPHIFWILAKILEIYVLGQVGSIVSDTTDNMSLMYYESNWESIVACSSNSRQNVRLMKLVQLAITTNSKKFSLTGWNFFSVSLNTAVTMFRLAGSYFTCLLSMRSV